MTGKKWSKMRVGVGTFILLYILFWVFGGEHGYTYYLEPAKQVGDTWTCRQGTTGPFWDNGKGTTPVCHDPTSQCPVLWFPLITQVPCPYKDPLLWLHTPPN
jgi:hypothetical protein